MEGLFIMNTKDIYQKRKCFIITPIGELDSPIFRKAEGVIKSVIKPILIRNGFYDIKPSYEIMESGLIGNQIIDRIINDDLVVANLTGNNPNVMYELAVRHAIAKPIIHICEKGTNLSFDIKHSRTIFYNDDMLGTEELKTVFEQYVINIDYTKEYLDNPICGKSYKIKNIFTEFKSVSDNADILIRLQSNDIQMEKFQKEILSNIPDLSIISFQKVKNVYLIYIKNKGRKNFIELSTLLRKISKNIGVQVFFIDDLKVN